MSDFIDNSTPSRPSASPTPPSVTFSRSTSRRELFESTALAATSSLPDTPTPDSQTRGSSTQHLAIDSAHTDGTQPNFQGELEFDFSGGPENIFFAQQADHATTPASLVLDVGKYRRIAENTGLRGEQADTAISLAIMTPRAARVHLYSQVTHAINLITKFREVQVRNWEIPNKTQAHTVTRLALLAPIPFCYKDDLPLLVLRILIKDGTLSRDFETKHQQRAEVVVKEIARHANHVRSDMKIAILASMTPAQPVNILTLTHTLCKPCGKHVNLTKELLGAIAYLRAITALQAEDRTVVALKADEKVWWGLLEHRVKETRLRHKTVDARTRHLQDWLENDQVAYGRVDAEKLAELRTDPALLQAAVFEAQRRGPEELKKDIARAL